MIREHMPITGRRIFCSYSHRDKELMAELKAHFAGLISTGRVSAFWSDGEMSAGTEFEPRIAAELDRADVILLLISAYYFASEYCWTIEAPRAFKRHEAGQAKVISVLLRDAVWKISPLEKYVVLPRDGNAVTNSAWKNEDEAFRHIVEEVDRVIKEIIDPESMRSAKFVEPAHNHEEPTNAEVFHCVPHFEEVTIRAAGVTELLGDVVLEFRGDPGDYKVCDLWLYWNTNVTSRIESGNFSEIALTIATGRYVSSLPVLGRGLRAVQTAANAVAFMHVPLHELRLLPVEERKLRIGNVRVNAAQLFFSSVLYPTRIAMHIKTSDVSVHPTSNLLVANIAEGYRVVTQIIDAHYEPGCFRQSVSLNQTLLAKRNGKVQLSLLVTFSGRLAGFEQIPGQRTRLLLNFGAIPAGVSLHVTKEAVENQPRTLAATLTQADANGGGRFEEPEVQSSIHYNNRYVGLSRLDIHGSSAYAVWEIENGAGGEQSLTVGIALAYVADPANNRPGLGSAMVTASLAPLTTVNTASSTAPIPRFAPEPRAELAFTIVP